MKPSISSVVLLAGLLATLLPWPADAPVRLADAGVCAEAPAADVESLFAGATTPTFFTDADVTYAVSAVPQYPGRTC